MRTEQEMYELIINVARKDENIRGVVLYGSRVNPTVTKDQYQDYDIYYIVRDMDKYIENYKSTACFGAVELTFRPDLIYKELFTETLLYLMLFDDGNRIDLNVCSLKTFSDRINGVSKGHPMKCLLDKDKCMPALNDTDESAFYIKRPNEKEFMDTCAEFFWELQNVAKGIMRDELSFVMFLRDIALRDMLNRMIDWYIGTRTDFNVTVGTLGKYRKKYLDKKYYELYRKTYSDACYENVWISVYIMIDLFSELGKMIAEKFGYAYLSESENNIRKHIERIRALDIDLP